jgi:hypothetical protein
MNELERRRRITAMTDGELWTEYQQAKSDPFDVIADKIRAACERELSKRLSTKRDFMMKG